MIDFDARKAPFPWFGGKSRAAPVVWRALGDPAHYVEPFAGSLAVLLARPEHQVNRTYYSETVNDLDGLLVNAWRAIQLRPDEAAEAASWPVSEADLHARHVAVMRWRAERDVERLMGDPAFCDPAIAGWWLWGQSIWIGSGWCSGHGPWWVDDEGRFAKRRHDELGANRKGPSVGDNGHGVNHAGLREPGVSRQRPHLGNDGEGVNRSQLREPGVYRKRPHLGNNGEGVNHAGLREPGVEAEDYHPLVMPRLRQWFAFLAARLRHVRIVNGDWHRICTHGALNTLSCRQEIGHVGVFLDPPYSAEAKRDDRCYAVDDLAVAHDVRAWALEHGARYRVVLAGFEGEGHEDLEAAGWRVEEWYKAGFLQGGYGNIRKDGKTQQDRERLWLSPACPDHRDGFGWL